MLNVLLSLIFFYDHMTLKIYYTLPPAQDTFHTRSRINIPPKFCPTYIAYMTALLPTFSVDSPEELYSSLVHATHAFYLHYVSRPHIKQQTRSHAWTLDGRLCEAEQAAEADGLLYQRNPTPQHLC